MNDNNRFAVVVLGLKNAKWQGYQDFLGNLRNTGLLVPTTVQEVHSQEAPPERKG